MDSIIEQVTLAGLDPHQLAKLEKNIYAQLEQRAARHTEVFEGTEADKGNWYGLALKHAAEIIDLEFKLARGE